MLYLKSDFTKILNQNISNPGPQLSETKIFGGGWRAKRAGDDVKLLRNENTIYFRMIGCMFFFSANYIHWRYAIICKRILLKRRVVKFTLVYLLFISVQGNALVRLSNVTMVFVYTRVFTYNMYNIITYIVHTKRGI